MSSSQSAQHFAWARFSLRRTRSHQWQRRWRRWRHQTRLRRSRRARRSSPIPPARERSPTATGSSSRAPRRSPIPARVPLLVLLHGSGERRGGGTRKSRVMTRGISRLRHPSPVTHDLPLQDPDSEAHDRDPGQKQETPPSATCANQFQDCSTSLHFGFVRSLSP